MSKQTFRFNLSNDILSYIQENFHYNNNIEEFKFYWLDWIDNDRIKILFDIEKKRLEQLGWKGNIYNKIYKSIRYYYINKDNNKKSQKKRRQYIHIHEKFSLLMKNYINNTNIVKPQKAFLDFKNNNIKNYNNEVIRLKEFLEQDIAENKIKKTFKNKFYQKKQNVSK